MTNQKSIDRLFLGNSTRIDHKIKIIWILIKLHRSDFSIKLSDLLDSNLSSETIITVVWPFGKTKQIHKMIIFTQNGLKKLFGVKTAVDLLICSVLLSKGYTVIIVWVKWVRQFKKNISPKRLAVRNPLLLSQSIEMCENRQ